MTQEALKLALEAMESVTVECNNFHHPKKDQNHHWAKCPPVVRWDKAITTIKEALAQEQKPVAWAHYDTFKNLDFLPTARFKATLATKNTSACCIALYTHPPQRTWVGLTDEEIFETHKQVDSMQYLTFGKAIEAKLKQKNGYTEENT